MAGVKISLESSKAHDEDQQCVSFNRKVQNKHKNKKKRNQSASFDQSIKSIRIFKRSLWFIYCLVNSLN